MTTTTADRDHDSIVDRSWPSLVNYFIIIIVILFIFVKRIEKKKKDSNVCTMGGPLL